jgi:acyl CoA:acetate/3-ketoacid CoA transferase
MQGQDVTYVTERCVIRLTPEGLMVTEMAPGLDLQRDILQQADIPLEVSPDLKVMSPALYRPGRMGLDLGAGS